MVVATGVSNTHPSYNASLIKWKRCRDVVAGQDAIYAGKDNYLPKLKNEDIGDYEARMMRTPFFNASWRTVASFVGMMFRKDATLEAPDATKKLLEDVTGTGISFNNLAKNIAYENLTVSFLGVFVDYPAEYVKENGGTLTIPEAEALGLRPVMTLYNAESIRNWDHRRINNKTVLSQVRLGETQRTLKPGSEFEYEEKAVIRLLDLDEVGNYRIRVFSQDNEEQIGGAVYPKLNGQFLKEVPFYFIGPDGTDAKIEEPVNIDLFNHNIKHYQVSADYEHACHMTALPTPFITGYRPTVDIETGKSEDPDFYIGSGTAWVFPDKDTKVAFLEYNGSGISSIKSNLDDKKEEMAALGARALAPDKAGVESQKTQVTRNTGENSILGAVSLAISAGLTKALDMFNRWAGQSGTCKYELNREFVPFTIDPASLTAWMALIQAGLMTKEDLFDLLKRGDMVDPETEFEDWQSRLEVAVDMPAPIGDNGGPPIGDNE